MKPRFKVGQIVFREAYGMGHFEQTPIAEVALSEKSKREGNIDEWIYRVDELGQGSNYNWLAEIDLFETLMELKEAWIIKILALR